MAKATLKASLSLDQSEFAKGIKSAIAKGKGLAKEFARNPVKFMAVGGLLGFERGVKGIASGLVGLGRVAGRAFGLIGGALKVAGVGAVAVGVAVAAATVKAVAAASNMYETVSKTEAIFGGVSAGVIKWSKTMAGAFGQSKQQALDAAATFATFGKGAGLTGEKLVKFASGLGELASDFASFFNTSPEDAIVAIGAALRGEQEPIRRYGVLLNDAALKEQAFSMGLIKTTKEALSPQNKVLAAHAVILKQTKDAQGDFARTSSGLANQQRILKARFDDATAALGAGMLPAALMVVSALTKIADAGAKINLGKIGEEFADGVIRAVDAVIGAFKDPKELGKLIASSFEYGAKQGGNIMIATFSLAVDFLKNGLIDTITGIGSLMTATLLDAFEKPLRAFQDGLEFAIGKIQGEAEDIGDRLIPGGSPAGNAARAAEDKSYNPKTGRYETAGPGFGSYRTLAEVQAENKGKKPISFGGMNADELRVKGKEDLGKAGTALVNAVKGFKIEDVFGAAEVKSGIVKSFNNLADKGQEVRQRFLAPKPEGWKGDWQEVPSDPWHDQFKQKGITAGMDQGSWNKLFEQGGLESMGKGSLSGGGLSTSGLTSRGLGDQHGSNLVRRGDAARARAAAEAEKKKEPTLKAAQATAKNTAKLAKAFGVNDVEEGN